MFSKKTLKVPSGNRIHPARCTGRPLAHEWGSWLALLLSLFFITPETVGWLLWLTRRQPEPRPCGTCGNREQAINAAGEQATGRFNQALAWLTGYNTHKGER
jgi:hypothetical protein